MNSGNAQTTTNSSGREHDLETAPAAETHASRAPIGSGMENVPVDEDYEIDDRGTDQCEASEILRKIRDDAFDSSNEKLALALGRPTEEIEKWTSGEGTIDGDVVLKASVLTLKFAYKIGRQWRGSRQQFWSR
jgi:hypothetical protein